MYICEVIPRYYSLSTNVPAGLIYTPAFFHPDSLSWCQLALTAWHIPSAFCDGLMTVYELVFRVKSERI